MVIAEHRELAAASRAWPCTEAITGFRKIHGVIRQ
jgi:hypothetical protein